MAINGALFVGVGRIGLVGWLEHKAQKGNLQCLLKSMDFLVRITWGLK
jgi:hypothetical protein